MKKIGKIFIGLSLALLVLWLVPWVYRIVTLESYSTPFTLYSCVVHDFTSLDRSDARNFRFIDRKGNVYGDEVQPLFYHSILASKGAFPDSLEGIPVTEEMVEHNSVILSAEPKEFNVKKAPVYLLMESVPVRLELHDPEDAFVVRKNGLAVYRMADNTLLEEKTGRFNAALSAEGFRFPAHLVAGKPSHHKEYDEGYLLTDAEGKLFHLKQVDGEPAVRHFPAADSLDLRQILITEFTNRATLGYLVDRDNRLHMLRPDGTVIPTEVRYDPAREDLLVVGDLFYYTVKTSDADGEHFFALRSDDFSLVDRMDRPYDFEEEVNLCKYVFPCRLSFTSSDHGWVKPRFSDFSWIGLVVDLLVAVFIIAWRWRRKNTNN